MEQDEEQRQLLAAKQTQEENYQALAAYERHIQEQDTNNKLQSAQMQAHLEEQNQQLQAQQQALQEEKARLAKEKETLEVNQKLTT
jgi:hypothetical protein